MLALNRKLLRNLWSMKGQAVAIMLVVASGVATFVMSISTLRSLSATQEAYYERYRFAHVFAHVKRAPLTLVTRIRQITGVAEVQTRIVAEVNLDVPQLSEPALGRILSLPEPGGLNQIYLRRGRMIDASRKNEVLVSESFAAANTLEPGDSIGAVLNGRWQNLQIVGIALSPEYVIQIRGADLLPDDKRFGILWMDYEQLAAVFDLEGAFNDITLSLMRGVSIPEVLMRLDVLTEPYGGVGAYDREDQISHRYLSDEISQLRSMGLIAPTIFLGVAAFLLNLVLARLVATQREEIAMLRAFGYSSREIGRHYLLFMLVIVATGVLVGSSLGGWMGQGLTRLYTRFYKFPLFTYELEAWVIVLAGLISSFAGLLGIFSAVRQVVSLPPAEAMRPPAPASYRPTIIERIGLQKLLPQTARMILRQLERRPFKSALTSVGVAMAVAILVLGSFMEDSLDYLIEYQFFVAQRQDITISFVEPLSPQAADEVRQLPGVLQSETMRAIPTKLRFDHHMRRTSILGLASSDGLYRLLENGRPVALPSEGLLLSDKLAELLHVRLGDVVTVEVLEGQRSIRNLPVRGIIAEYNGTNAYMHIDALRRLLGEGRTVSGAFLAVDSLQRDKLYKTLKNTPQVASVAVKEATLQTFQDTVAENLNRMRFFNVLFAIVIAFGVVYNSARISLSERSHELATLRVMGFTRTEISAVLLGELVLLTTVAIPLGLILGYAFAYLTSLGLDTELYRIPLVVRPSTYGFAALTVIVATILSGLVVRQKLDHLDLVTVLKTKE